MIENKTWLRIHADDNLIVALQDLVKGCMVECEGVSFEIMEDIKAKHKFACKNFTIGDDIIMYGVLVGRAYTEIKRGSLISTKNVSHATSGFRLGNRKIDWKIPDIGKWRNSEFMGYHRSDGSVGTANYWIVIPLVFCENRNVDLLKEILLNSLGYKEVDNREKKFKEIIRKFQREKIIPKMNDLVLDNNTVEVIEEKVFENLDGIKFLTHQLGCGGTRDDAQSLCALLAGYITHSNVAGATVLSLGCQHAQVNMLNDEILKRDDSFNKPLIILEQQLIGTEERLIQEALIQTFEGLIKANSIGRRPAPISKLCIGLECGGSDGFSGISANPAIGHTSDLLVALGGSVILSEFPELCGVEQELSDRCINEEIADKFLYLMDTYNKKAEEAGSGFFANPSPGNIKDGLITDAIKSAGAARKAGSSPVVDVLDYPEKVTKAGLNLLCTPGNDVESTTAEVASGANIVLFTTGLGTPTGNPIAPVIKVSTNTDLFIRMPDIIDMDCGTIVNGEETIEMAGERILEYLIAVASGEAIPKAVKLNQDDFIPWKRGVSL